MKSWNVTVNGKQYEVVFNGRSLSGKGKFLVNNEKVACDPVIVRKVAQFYLLEVDGEELLVKCNGRGQAEDIIQNGRYLESGQPWEDEVSSELGPQGLARNPLVIKERTGMGTYLTFVALTYVNIFLIWIDATVSFPFSATTPQFIMAMFLYSYDPNVVLAVGISLAVASIFLVLYLLSKSGKIWPLALSLAFVLADTLILLYIISFGDMNEFFIDAAFHVWVIASLIRLIINRKKRLKEVAAEAKYPDFME